MEDLDHEFLAWLAGFWEGEGSLSVRKTSTKKRGDFWHRSVMSIKQKKVEPLQLIQSKLGGRVSIEKAGKNRLYPIHRWEVSKRAEVIRIAHLLVPFLKFRGEDVKAKLKLMEYLEETNPRPWYSAWETAFIEDNFPEMGDVDLAKKLNRSADGVKHFRTKLGLFRLHPYKVHKVQARAGAG